MVYVEIPVGDWIALGHKKGCLGMEEGEQGLSCLWPSSLIVFCLQEPPAEGIGVGLTPNYARASISSQRWGPHQLRVHWKEILMKDQLGLPYTRLGGGAEGGHKVLKTTWFFLPVLLAKEAKRMPDGKGAIFMKVCCWETLDLLKGSPWSLVCGCRSRYRLLCFLS